MSDLRDKLDALADASPPAPTGAQRDREIQAAITRGLATPARESRRVWPWIAVGTGLAAAAAIVLWLRMRDDAGGTQVAIAHDAAVIAPDAVADLVVERGVAAPVGAVVEASELTVLRAPDGTRIEANAQTRFARETGDSKRWRLERGQLAVRVAPNARLEVATPEARLVVVGSQFVVGRYASETVVEVLVGDVLVSPTDGGEQVVVHAGERWPREAPIAVDAGVAVVDAAPVIAPPARDAGVAQFDASTIRKTIRAGKVGDAREMIEASRTAHASSKRALAELGVLAAEADLAERKTRSAIEKYLAVVRDYSSTPQAEQALFAAAQLAMDRPDAGYKAEALLRDYVDTYPKGQFSKDARRLLDSLKK